MSRPQSKRNFHPFLCIFLLLFSFGAPAAGGSLFGNNNAAAKPLFGQTAGTSFGATNTFGTPGASSFGAAGFGGAQMGGMGGTGAYGQPQAQAQGQQGQGKINFQDLLQVNNLEKDFFLHHFIKNGRVEFLFKFFDKMVNKIEFQKNINLYKIRYSKGN